jgi:hypothetical protein
MILPVKLQVLEMNVFTSKKDVTYHNLICYQAGSQYPELIKIGVDAPKVDEAEELIGEVDVTIEVEQSNFKGQSRYNYIRTI